MIVLTGDVHHRGMGGHDQRQLRAGVTELDLCAEYLEIANAAGIVPTLYMTGKTAADQPDLFARLARDFKWEAAGHTYNAYQPLLLWNTIRRLLGRRWPPALQRLDAKLTRRAILAAAGTRIVSWRNHAYVHDRNTDDVLEELGFLTVSNWVADIDSRYVGARRTLLQIPINVLPDHEFLSHGNHRHLEPGEWLAAVRRQVTDNEANGRHSMILAHPACQFIEDGYAGLRELVAFLAPFKTCTAHQFQRTRDSAPTPAAAARGAT